MNNLLLGLGLSSPSKGGGAPVPPAGFVFLINDDGSYRLTDDGFYEISEAY